MSPEPDRLGPDKLGPDKLGLVVRVGLFVLIGWLGEMIFPWAMLPLNGILVASAMSTFAAAALANAIVVRIYENGRLSDLGLGWTATSAREILTGIGAGVAAAVVIMAAPLALHVAEFEREPNVENGAGHAWASLAFVSVVLLFGAAGEEMLFHGYAFQLLVRSLGAFATILPAAVLFGLAHAANQNATLLGVANTMLWGVLLGYACWRTGALWLPIGLHFGWNFALPLFGVNLSGFTMGVTGYGVHWRTGDLWSGGSYGPEGGLPTTAIVVALFFVLRRVTPERGDA